MIWTRVVSKLQRGPFHALHIFTISLKHFLVFIVLDKVQKCFGNINPLRELHQISQSFDPPMDMSENKFFFSGEFFKNFKDIFITAKAVLVSDNVIPKTLKIVLGAFCLVLSTKRKRNVVREFIQNSRAGQAMHFDADLVKIRWKISYQGSKI